MFYTSASENLYKGGYTICILLKSISYALYWKFILHSFFHYRKLNTAANDKMCYTNIWRILMCAKVFIYSGISSLTTWRVMGYYRSRLIFIPKCHIHTVILNKKFAFITFSFNNSFYLFSIKFIFKSWYQLVVSPF